MRKLVRCIQILCYICCISFLGISQSWSTTLDFVPNTSSILVGESIDIEIEISDLGGSFVGGFNFDVTYDDSILSLDSYSLTDNLGVISSGEADDWSTGELVSGTVNFGELSWFSAIWGDDFSVLTPQDGTTPFMLATLTFTADAVGTSGLDLANVLVSDDLDTPLFVSTDTGSISVSAPAPEPTTMFLFGFGLICFAGAGRRKIS